jgi:hypothetical protein
VLHPLSVPAASEPCPVAPAGEECAVISSGEGCEAAQVPVKAGQAVA